MKIYKPRSWVLTDEHPMAAKEKPVLIDLETRKTYHPGDRIMGVSAQQVVSLVVEERGENYLLPIYFHGFPSLNRENENEREPDPPGPGQPSPFQKCGRKNERR